MPKPPELSFEQAACLPTAWLTAYRMLFTNSGVQPGGTVLVQGAGGGVATALVQLGSAAGPDNQRCRRRQPDRARARDDQHRDRGGESRRHRSAHRFPLR